MGIDSVAVELNPFACLMTRAKVGVLNADCSDFSRLPRHADGLYRQFVPYENRLAVQPMLSTVGEPRDDTADVLAGLPGLSEPMRELVLLCYLDAVGYASRRKGKTPRDLFPDLLGRYLAAVAAFNGSREELGLALGKAQVIEGDARGLQSFFMVMPKGAAFVDFARFAQAYEALRVGTSDFAEFSEGWVLDVVRQDSLALVVLRTMVGLSPPELAHVASLTAGVAVDQSAARRLDKRAREGADLFARSSDKSRRQVEALVRTAVQMIEEGSLSVGEGVIHRLDKLDTREGLAGVRAAAEGGVRYEALLYERFLGRPFATRRDAVSERVGDILEDAVTGRLRSRSIPFRKARVAERFEDMDQGPDFLIPDAVRTAVVIEAKLAEDDGTARDKVTRVQHLAELRDRRLREGGRAFEVVACVDGRGFGIRREDVKKLLLSTKGKLFTLQTIDSVVDATSLEQFGSLPGGM